MYWGERCEGEEEEGAPTRLYRSATLDLGKRFQIVFLSSFLVVIVCLVDGLVVDDGRGYCGATSITMSRAQAFLRLRSGDSCFHLKLFSTRAAG